MAIVSQHQVHGHFHLSQVSNIGWRKGLLGCGIVATLFYVGLDVVAAALCSGYSYTDQTISELSAIGAQTRSLWIPAGFVYSLLAGAGASGIWLSAGGKRSVRVIACLVGLMGILGLVGWPFAPMHQREVLAAGGGTFSDTMHLVLAGINSLLFVVSIAYGSTVFGKRFRAYSIITLALILVFGFITGMDASKVSANEATPWLGIAERITVYGSMIWIAAFSLRLWTDPAKDEVRR